MEQRSVFANLLAGRSVRRNGGEYSRKRARSKTTGDFSGFPEAAAAVFVVSLASPFFFTLVMLPSSLSSGLNHCTRPLPPLSCRARYTVNLVQSVAVVIKRHDFLMVL